MEEEVVKISQILDRIENGTSGDEVREWLENLSSENFKFISFLVSNTQIKPSLNETYIKVLRQLLDFSFPSVFNDLKKKPEFSNALFDYIVETQSSDLNSNLVHIFLKVHAEEQNFFKVNVEVFLNILSFIGYVRDEAFLMRFVKVNVPMFIEEFMKSPNAKVVLERLLIFLNWSEGEEKAEYLNIVFEVMKLNMDYFFTNDLKALCDIILQVFDHQEIAGYAVSLQILMSLAESEFTEYKYRLSEIIEAVEGLDNDETCVKYKVQLISKLSKIN